MKYPKKIFINEETGLGSDKSCNIILGDENMRINWIIKLSLLSIENDIKQNHNNRLADQDKCGYGDYVKLVLNDDIEKYFKSSSKVRNILRKINLEKYVFDSYKTLKLRNNLTEDIFGVVLKRNFSKEIEDEYDYDYIYSIWLRCDDKEILTKTKFKLNIPFNPLIIDYKGREQNATNSSEILISGTPVFLLGNIDHEENFENEENKKIVTVNNNNKLILFMIFFFIIMLIIFGISFFLYHKIRNKKNNIQNNVSDKGNYNNKVEKYNQMKLLENYTE
jgi:hypothetical protein